MSPAGIIMSFSATEPSFAATLPLFFFMKANNSNGFIFVKINAHEFFACPKSSFFSESLRAILMTLVFETLIVAFPANFFLRVFEREAGNRAKSATATTGYSFTRTLSSFNCDSFQALL